MENSLIGTGNPRQYKKYKKEDAISYTLGPFPTFELLDGAAERVVEVIIDEEFTDKEKLEIKCRKLGVPFTYSKKTLERISNKEICYAAGIFEKYTAMLDNRANHVVLNNPSDMGNLGTIIRTLLGFGIKNLAIITPAADIFNPKVIRASMGAMFKMNFALFPSFEAYLAACGKVNDKNRDIFPFMLDGNKILSIDECPISECYSLVFGNEAAGLPPEFADYGTSIFIPQSEDVDSLNLAVSVAVGSFIFTSVNKKIIL